MYNIIELLIYIFTNRLTKSVVITLNNGYPADEQEKESIRLRFETKHKCEVSLLFTGNGKPSEFEWFYIKK